MMSLLLIVSILSCLTAMMWFVPLFRPIRKWRLGILTMAFGLLALSQAPPLFAAQTSSLSSITGSAGFIVSIAALVIFLLFDHILAAHELTKKKSQELLESAPDAIVIVDQHGTIVMVNTQTEALFGYTREEMLGASAERLLPEPHRARHRKHRADYIAHPKTHPMGTGLILRGLRKDGSTFPAEISLSPLETQQGLLISGAIRDVTERKKAEEAARQSHRFLRSTLDALPTHIAVLDENGTIIAVNKAWQHFAETNHATPDRVGIGTDYLEVCDSANGAWAEEAPAVAAAIRALIAGRQETFSLEYPCHSPEKKRWFTLHMNCFTAGEAVRVVMAHENITKRKQAEKRETHLGRILEGSLNEIYLFDAETLRFLEVNRGAQENIGYSLDELYTLTPFDLKPELTPETFAQLVEPLRTGAREKIDFTTVHRRKDGSLYPVEVHLQLSTWERSTVFVAIILDITKHKQAEEALRASEERYRRVVEDQTEYVMRWLPDGTVLFANDSYCRYFGKTSGELEGTTLFDLIPEADHARLRQKIDSLTSEHPIVREEHPVTRPDGSRGWHAWNDRAIFDETGRIREYQSVGRDITEHKRAEEALQASEEFNRRIVEAIPSGIVHVSMQGAILYANDEAQQILGLSYDALTRSYVADFEPLTIWEDGSPCPAEDYPVSRCLQTGVAQPPVTIGVHRPDGITWAVYTAVPLLTPETEQANGAVVTFLDITERKRAEEALQASEERNRAFLDGIPDMMFRLRTDGAFLDYKAESAQELAVPPEAIIGSTLTESPMPAELVEGMLRCVQQAMTTGEVQTYVYELAVPIGIQAYEARIVRSGADEVVCIVRNVTARKRAEAEQERLIEELEARNAELERFTYTVSHDLKSPLVTIKGFLGLLMQDVKTGNEEALEHHVERISKAADQMGRLLNELLELSRIGRVINPPEEVSLTELAHEALDLVTDQLTERGVVVEIAPDLPVVFGDRLRLLEVLQNLIDNAVKFMGDQSKPHIEIGSRKDDHDVVCYVQDNGIGINPPYHEQIFGLFNRLDSVVEGTGIGLALVKRIVEMHGGRIWVESEGKGLGSTFCFSVPL